MPTEFKAIYDVENKVVQYSGQHTDSYHQHCSNSLQPCCQCSKNIRLLQP